MLGVEGAPIEYSWKWNTATTKPDVRYTVEVINQFSGTEMDPLNQDPSRELLNRLKTVLPSVDLTWTNHFLATLYDHDRSKYVQEAATGAHYASNVLIAAEIVPKRLTMKSYFIPRRLGQSQGLIPVSMWEESLAQLDPTNAARTAVYDFVSTNSEGKLLSPL